jgi:hypothetical protein
MVYQHVQCRKYLELLGIRQVHAICGIEGLWENSVPRVHGTTNHPNSSEADISVDRVAVVFLHVRLVSTQGF